MRAQIPDEDEFFPLVEATTDPDFALEDIEGLEDPVSEAQWSKEGNNETKGNNVTKYRPCNFYTKFHFLY